ncbi:hypothetical protein Rumeso_04364 [Rubellimicrobium mesophilum DSM 19309]|uniref:Uncharacterized protein n=1 Tax=Rubellimicrobium mesophilum DSM 19309 TaxID=442562 RepID=A0A017HID7_9RHOB|nr:hypothetical protein Rumeso_04364 [Rubellimicrobium mesophilum DSM 19309]
MLLIEGRWHTGAGLSAEEVRRAVPPSLRWTATRSLSDHHALWGGPVSDERFLFTARRR